MDIEAIKARRSAAMDEVIALSNGNRKWTMCIPVQKTDSDWVIGEALRDISDLVAEVERLTNAMAEIREAHQEIRITHAAIRHEVLSMTQRDE